MSCGTRKRAELTPAGSSVTVNRCAAMTSLTLAVGRETGGAQTDAHICQTAMLVVHTLVVTINPKAAAHDIERDLRALGTPERAAGEKRYLKSDLEFLGATMGQIRRVVKAIAKSFAEQHGEMSMTSSSLSRRSSGRARFTSGGWQRSYAPAL